MHGQRVTSRATWSTASLGRRPIVPQLDYDFVLQLNCDVLRDVQTRVLNASLFTNLALSSPISRVLAQTVAPFQMKAHWAKPDLNIAEDVVKVSADVAGGARYFIEGISLNLEGQGDAGRRPRVVANDGGQPVVTLAPPSPLDLHLGDLKLNYKGHDELLSPNMIGFTCRTHVCAAQSQVADPERKGLRIS